jgi:hypothetical protein
MTPDEAKSFYGKVPEVPWPDPSPEMLNDPIFNEIFHPISRRLVAKCDGCLRIGGPSAGADEMVALARANGKAVYVSLDEIPVAS